MKQTWLPFAAAFLIAIVSGFADSAVHYVIIQGAAWGFFMLGIVNVVYHRMDNKNKP